MKARVFIALATGILGGPGKGLVQFLRFGGLEGCAPLVVDYSTDPENTETEYVRAVRAAGAPVAFLRQKRILDCSLVDQALPLLREHKVDLLQSHGYKSHVLCALLRRKTDLPWLAFVHGWTAENFKIRCYTALEHLILLGADQVVAVSASLRSRLLSPVRAKCRVIPNAVDVGELRGETPDRDVRAEFDIPAQALVAGVVGRLSPEKGQIHFLRALAEARRSEPRLYGLLVGDGQERTLLEAEARSLGLAGNLVFTGHVRGLAPFYRAMDIQVLPSHSEGMPNAALEGMLLGRPLIASKVGGVPEVVEDGHTGILLSPGDEPALARALSALAGDPARRAALGAAGQKRATKHFTPRARAERILRLYDDILERHRRKGADA